MTWTSNVGQFSLSALFFQVFLTKVSAEKKTLSGQLLLQKLQSTDTSQNFTQSNVSEKASFESDFAWHFADRKNKVVPKMFPKIASNSEIF